MTSVLRTDVLFFLVKGLLDCSHGVRLRQFEIFERLRARDEDELRIRVAETHMSAKDVPAALREHLLGDATALCPLPDEHVLVGVVCERYKHFFVLG